MNWTDKIQVYNEDCMQTMARYEDNFFDLAIIDPPYGIGEDGLKNHSRDKAAKAKKYTPKNWDKSAPQKEYFKELKRVSKQQIIWGANHFIENIPNANSSCWVVWDKNNTGDFADAELAYTSLKTAVRVFKFRWNGMLQQDMKNKEIRIHPTQKPVALYSWILENYAKPNDIILDTHLGSGSNAIACHYFGCSLVAAELDKEYYKASLKRFKQQTAQKRLF